MSDPPHDSEAPTVPPTPTDPVAAHSAGAAAPPTPTQAVAPSVFGYQIIRELGRGGMGVVYMARHLRLDRMVALKMILAGGHAGADDLARFRTEAEAVARLQHPNVVQIFEVGEHGGLPFFSLEFCGGGALNRKLGGTPLPAGEAAALVETLARAMQAAHEKGVIHRDLKPANVLLADDGTPKVTDFGLAKKLDAAEQTQSGAIMGTPSYMAPEQAGGRVKEMGPACDIYALGAILYECLTGRPPFKAATPLDTILQVVADEPVPPRQLQSRTPRDLQTICLKCLEKQPGRRYATAADLAEDLRRFGAGEPIKARPVGPAERAVKWVRRHAAVSALAAAVLLAIALGVAGVLWKYLDAVHEADKAKKAREFLVSIFKKAEMDEKGANLTVRQVLEQADARIPVEFADQPELRAELVKAVGEVKRGIARRVPHAMILDVRGTVALRSAAGEKRVAANQQLLYLDDRLMLGGGESQVQVVFMSDFHKERLRPGAVATIDSGGCEPADAVLERDDSILMTFVRLQKGTFYMGWGTDPSGKPLMGVKTEIGEDFEIAVHDVTQGQWQAVMGNNPSHFSRQGDFSDRLVGISDEELKLFPVEYVSWDDAQEFIKKLNEKERGRGYLYRLPTEAEWEYACRGGSTSEENCSHHFYPSWFLPADDLSSEQANFNGLFPFGKAPKGGFLARPSRVGEYPPNQLGLCDMHGNVFQWTETAEGSDRVIRGGCWSDSGSYCQAACRVRQAPAITSYACGFRLARVPVR